MATRQIYQGDLLYVGPTGQNFATGKHFSAATFGVNPTGNGAGYAGFNLVAELYRVQRADYTWNKQTQDVNQLGELAAIDRVSLEQPNVSLSFNYLLANLINEDIMGFTVAKPGSASEISCISGILGGYDSRNFFIKTVSEGNDAIDNNSNTFNVISIGNAFLSSYAVQGAVGGFPTVDISVEGLNMDGSAFSSTTTGTYLPAVNPVDGVPVTGFLYNLPTGLTSLNNASLTANQGVSVLRPGDINLSLIPTDNAGDGFFKPSDLKVQNFNLSFSLSRENLSKLGSKFAFAKAITFPVTAQLQVSAIVGDHQTGSLYRIVEDNKDFNPTITITKPGDSTVTMAQFKLRGAKLDSQDISSNIGANKSVSMTFSAQIGGPQDSTRGVFMSGIAT
jgi:hypothetical protein